MRRLSLYFAALVIAVFTFEMLWMESHLLHGFLVDDAYISLRYARNFADGNGLVYNVGERVEGYTNFSLTILASLPYWLGLDAVTFVKAMGWLAGASLILTTGELARRLAGSMAAAAVMAVMALDQRYAWLSGCGLETIMVGALYVPGLLFLDRRKYVLAGLFFALAALTRMETLLLFGIAAGFLVLRSGFRPTRPFATWRHLRRPAIFVAAVALPYGTYYVWRFAYYGWPFPNTYYAKVGSITGAWRRGLDYLDASLTTMGIRTAVFASAAALLLVLAGYAVRFVLRRPASVRPRSGLGPLVAVSCIVYASYVVLVGGDHFLERFVYHFYPLLLATMVCVWRALIDVSTLASRTRPAVTRAISGVIVAVLLAPLAISPVLFGNSPGLAGWATVGAYLRETAKTNPQATVATCAAGVIASESNLRTIDMLGLTDEHIAHLKIDIGRGTPGHEKADPIYILDRSPDFITTWIDADGHIGRGFRAFYRQWRDYELAQVVRTDTRLDISFDRLLPIAEDTLLATVALRAAGKGSPLGYYNWGVWKRRTGPVPRRTFGRMDFGSQVPGATEHEDALVVVPAGRAAAHVMTGPYILFPAGHYLVSFALEIKGGAEVAPETELCVFDVWDQVTSLHRQTLIARDWLNHAQTLATSFVVLPESSSRRFEFRLYCGGGVDLTVRSGWLDACTGDCDVVRGQPM